LIGVDEFRVDSVVAFAFALKRVRSEQAAGKDKVIFEGELGENYGLCLKQDLSEVD
jgi:hypothetical protein